MDEIATFFGCAKSTIAERYHAEYDRGREIGKMNIRRKQYQVAMGTPGSLDPISGALIPAVLPSVAMLIWLGKQWLGQADKQEVQHSTLDTIEAELARIERERERSAGR